MRTEFYGKIFERCLKKTLTMVMGPHEAVNKATIQGGNGLL